MSDTEIPNKKDKFNLIQKSFGLLYFVFLILLWVADRSVHIILFHRTHDRFGDWAKNQSERKFAVARVIIFLIPILIYKMIAE